MEFTQSLKNNRDFRRLYSRGKSSGDRFLVLYSAKNRTPDITRLGITVSGKLGGAVTRNKIRRRLKEAYRVNEARFIPGYDIVAVARFRVTTASFDEICSSLLSLAAKQQLTINN